MASEPVRSTQSIKLGDEFELDLGAYELRRSGRALKLERIPMELLLLLVERRGQLVTREQILAKIWGKDVCIEADNSINAAIRKIRQVLKDDPERPRFIQTVTGRGYRFIAPTVQIGAAEVIQEPARAQTVAAENPAETRYVTTVTGASAESPTVPPLTALARRQSVILGTAILFVMSVAAYFLWSHARSRTQASGGRMMLAVLPFENLTGDSGQDYFSDGLTEEMIAQIGRLDPQRLGVIGRTSVMHYKENRAPLDQIGRELAVQYVLEGSIRRDSSKVRITAQLIQVRQQTHLWARQYDRELSNLLSVQAEIAHEIADEIELTLAKGTDIAASHQPPLSPETYEAYELYLKGRYFWNKRTPQGFQQAIECFQQAIGKDPNYARAYAGLADSYALTAAYNLVAPTELIPKARAAAIKALELDEKLAEAHTSLALIAQNYDWDWQTAEKEYRRAIELDPNYATAHHWYAESLALQGRFDQAFAEIARARQLDPLSLIMAADHAAILYFSRQYDPAIKQFRAVLDMEPNFPRAYIVMWAYVQKGMFAEALADLEHARRFGTPAPWSWAMQALIYGRAGDSEKAARALKKLEALKRRQRIDPLDFVAAYMGLGDNDKALFWLNKACLEHSPSLTAIKVDPIYDSLRGDPRFQDVLRRMRLAQ